MMTRSVFMCPLCGKPLFKDDKACQCALGHCFDISREGYVNLLPANQKHSETPGDDKDMVRARARFLSSGWYQPLRESLCILVDKHAPEDAVFLDAGCGEGYYTEALFRVLTGRGGVAAGIDLSKHAVRRAAKRCSQAEFAVASVYHMPLRDNSADIILDCFSPFAEEEFKRILKPGGSLIYAVPGPEHLWELKEILYENPYQNTLREEQYPGFYQTGEIPLRYQIHLEDRENIMDLFHMTPYTWKTPREGIARLAEQSALDVTVQFRILIYKKQGSESSVPKAQTIVR